MKYRPKNRAMKNEPIFLVIKKARKNSAKARRVANRNEDVNVNKSKGKNDSSCVSEVMRSVV
jgi:hypothetical protein